MLHIQLTPFALFGIGSFCLILFLIEAGGLAAVGIWVMGWFFAIKVALEAKANQHAQKATGAERNEE